MKRHIALLALVLSPFFVSCDGNLYGPEHGPERTAPCAIDYLTHSFEVGGTLPVKRIGQSWIAPCTGYLSSISVYDNEQSKKGLYRLELFKGESTADTDKIGGFNDISISSGINQINIPFELRVTSGEQYTFLLTCDTGACPGLWLLFSATPYSDGRLIRNGWEDKDLYFRLSISGNP